jgi:hypothetical protein
MSKDETTNLYHTCDMKWMKLIWLITHWKMFELIEFLPKIFKIELISLGLFKVWKL